MSASSISSTNTTPLPNLTSESKKTEENPVAEQTAVSEETSKKEEQALKAKQEQERRLLELAFKEISFPDSFNSLKVSEAIPLYLMDFVSNNYASLSDECHTLILTFIHTFSEHLLKRKDEAFFKTFFSRLDTLIADKQLLSSLKKVCTRLKLLVPFSKHSIRDLKKAQEQSDVGAHALCLFSSKPIQIFCEWAFSLLLQVLKMNKEELKASELILFDPVTKKIIFNVKSEHLGDLNPLNTFQKRVSILEKRLLTHKNAILKELTSIASLEQQKDTSIMRCRLTQLIQRFSILSRAVVQASEEISKEYDTLFFKIPEKERMEIENAMSLLYLEEKEGDTLVQDYLRRLSNVPRAKANGFSQVADQALQMVSNARSLWESNRGDISKITEDDDDDDSKVIWDAFNGVDKLMGTVVSNMKDHQAECFYSPAERSAFKIHYKKIAQIRHSLRLFSNTLQLLEKLIKEISTQLSVSSLSEEEIDALWLLEEDTSVAVTERVLPEIKEEILEDKSAIPDEQCVQPTEKKIVFNDLMGAFYFVKKEIFRVPSSNWVKLHRQDFLHHLTLFLSTLELMWSQAKQEQFVSGMLFRLVKNISQLCEEGQSIRIVSKRSEPVFFKHDIVGESKKYNVWADFSNDTQSFLCAINSGSVFHRYPHKMSNVLKKDLPQTLNWLLQDKASKEEMEALVKETFAFLSFLYPETLFAEISASFQKNPTQLPQAAPNGFLEKSISSKKLPLRSLSSKVKKLAAQQRPNDPHAKRKEAHWKDIGKHVEWLKENLQLWISFPQLKFLGSHVDAILTNLQFIDEQIEECLNLELSGQIVRSNDLKYLREARQAEVEPFVAELNAHPGESYPHRISVQYKNEELPLALSLRLKAVALSQRSEALETKFIPATGKKNEDTLKDSEEIAQKLIELLKEEIFSADARIASALRLAQD